ncbi:Uncharacterised protein [Pragia fontium]|nr:Uncharacterised protein [Pragia fontium]
MVSGMKWKLCPLEQGENYISQVLHVTELPEMAVQLSSGFSWETILASLIAGCIPAFISYQAIKNTSKNINMTIDSQNKNLVETINSQENIAAKSMKVEVLSKNRQSWINELRDNSAKYLSLVIKVALIRSGISINSYKHDELLEQFELIKSNSAHPESEQYICAEKGLDGFLKAIERDQAQIRINQSELSLVVYKIRLLLNPSEEISQKIIYNMMSTVKELGAVTLKNEKEGVNYISKIEMVSEDFTALIQLCLKDEWERVKKIA